RFSRDWSSDVCSSDLKEIMNKIVQNLEKDKAQIKEWFEHMHKNPELSMQEEETAKFIADQVKSFGYKVETGIGKYGIVASLKVRSEERRVGKECKCRL